MSARSITIIVPDVLYDRLSKIEQKKGIRKEDLIARAIVKVIEEFEG
jgi:predicted DNA-binding protein